MDTPLQKLERYLQSQDIDYHFSNPKTESESAKITWKGEWGMMHVYDSCIAVSSDGKQLAWFEMMMTDDYCCLKVLKHTNELITWVPSGYYEYDRFYWNSIAFLKWIADQYLLFIFYGKYRTYIVVVEDGKLKEHEFNGTNIAILSDRVLYQGDQDGHVVNQISIPDMTPLPSANISYFTRQGIKINDYDFTNELDE